jgi:hypothetical protein
METRRMRRRLVKSARMPAGMEKIAPAKLTAAIRIPSSVLLMWKAFSRLPAMAETEALSAASRPNTAPRRSMTFSRAGPPTASTVATLARSSACSINLPIVTTYGPARMTCIT